MGLLWSAACFLAGCALTFALTLRYQIPDLGQVQHYLQEFYYFGNWNDLSAILDFTISGTWGVFDYHLAPGVSAIALIAIAILLLRVFAKRLRCTALHVLFLLVIASAGCAALLAIYPLGARRQTLYLTPALFLMAGHALDALILRPQLARRAWLAALAIVIVCASAGRLLRGAPYSGYRIDDLVTTLAEQVRSDDLVYVSARATPFLIYHQDGQKENYHYEFGGGCSWGSPTECLHRLVYALGQHVYALRQYEAKRLWLVFRLDSPPIIEDLRRWEAAGLIEQVVADGTFNLWLAADSASIVRDLGRQAYQAAVVTVPAARDLFDIYHDTGKNILTYVREGCGRADTEAWFFLHLIPADIEDLSEVRRQHGFDNHDFEFERRGGARFDGSCVVTVPLPDYAIERIRTGQYIPGEGRLWEVEFAMPGSR